MKRFLALALTLTLHAAQAATPKLAPAPPAPKIDPASRALFDASAKAYAALKGLSMSYVDTDQTSTRTSRATGTIDFSRPNLAKVIITDDSGTSLTLADGKKAYTQVTAKMFQGTPLIPGQEGVIDDTLHSLPWALSAFLPDLISGQNPLDDSSFGSAFSRVLPDHSVRMGFPNMPGSSVIAFTLTFDPTDKLLRRVEQTTDFKGRRTTNVMTLTNVQSNPVFASTAFRFQPAPGVKIVADVPEYDPTLKVGASPFALQGKDLSGKTHTLNEFKGKVVLLDFWATWCGPCVEELPNVLSNYRKYHRQGLEIIGVSLDEDDLALTDFIKTRHIPYPNLFDARGWKNHDAMTYGVQSIPFSLLIGKNGKIAAVSPRAELLGPAIKKALSPGKVNHRRRQSRTPRH